MSTIFWYSSAERPWRATSSSVISGCAIASARESRMTPLLDGASGRNRRKYLETVFTAEKLVGGILRVRHEAEDIACLVTNTGDILQRSVRVRRSGRLSFAVHVTEQNLTVLPQAFEGGSIRKVASFTVLYGHTQYLPF